MAMQPPSPRERGGPGYSTAVALVLAVVVAGALLGGVVLPDYLNVHPVFSPQPVTPAPAPAPTPPAIPATPGPSASTPALTAPVVPVQPPTRASALTPDEAVVINVVKMVRPAVVNINTESQVQTMFGVFPSQGAGSGVIVRANGYILTNNHVVQGATTIRVTLAGGKTLPGRSWGPIPFADLAVIKVDSPEPLPAAALGSSGASRSASSRSRSATRSAWAAPSRQAWSARSTATSSFPT